MDITNTFGMFKTMKLQQHQEGLGVDTTLYIHAATGDVIRMVSKARTTDILYNSLGVAKESVTMNPAGANLYNKEGLPAPPFRSDAGPA